MIPAVICGILGGVGGGIIAAYANWPVWAGALCGAGCAIVIMVFTERKSGR